MPQLTTELNTRHAALSIVVVVRQLRLSSSWCRRSARTPIALFPYSVKCREPRRSSNLFFWALRTYIRTDGGTLRGVEVCAGTGIQTANPCWTMLPMFQQVAQVLPKLPSHLVKTLAIVRRTVEHERLAYPRDTSTNHYAQSNRACIIVRAACPSRQAQFTSSLRYLSYLLFSWMRPLQEKRSGSAAFSRALALPPRPTLLSPCGPEPR